MKEKRVRAEADTRLIHVETPLGVINIHLGLTDSAGRRVENVSVICNDYAGERRVRVPDQNGSRTLSVRLVEEAEEERMERLRQHNILMRRS